MIEYIHNNFGMSFQFWFTIIGSSLPRAILAASFSIIIYFIMYSIDNISDFALKHPYSIGMVASVISFSIIFRSNSAINRYYEAAAVTHQMYSKWGDCTLQCITFHLHKSSEYNSVEFVDNLIHLVSLLGSVSCLTLRQDNDIGNLVHHRSGNILPTSPVATERLDRNSFGLWSWMTYIFGMRSDKDVRVNYNKCFPFPVIDGVTDDERNALQNQISNSARTSMCMMWVTDCITTGYATGAFGSVSPPVISRLYQELSDGMLGFNQARKIAYLPFPFVYAQATEFLMAFGMCIIPLLMIGFVEHPGLGSLLSFFTSVCFFALYESCRELEDPFLYEPNDLPLLNWQSQFNETLISLKAEQNRLDIIRKSKIN